VLLGATVSAEFIGQRAVVRRLGGVVRRVAQTAGRLREDANAAVLCASSSTRSPNAVFVSAAAMCPPAALRLSLP
jgi:hypothetical protein